MGAPSRPFLFPALDVKEPHPMGSSLDDAINEAFGSRSFDDDPTELKTLPYQPPRLRITASYEPDDKRHPTNIEIEVFGDVELTPDTVARITAGLAAFLGRTEDVA